ncbi:MAG: S41 family peptidase [Bacteroidales bacterium]|jgi:C-terminal processing protease CtpA/Prc|nr:S41 family peptidase [Bacteroidales bacterium]
MKAIVLSFIIIISISANALGQTENKISNNEKLFGLSLLWKEVSYNFAFFQQVPDLNWDSCYLATIPKVLETSNDWDYYLELQKFMSLLQDGHTRIFTPVQLRNKYFGTTNKQFTTKLIEGKVVITRVLDDLLSNKGLKQGMEIVAINEMNPFAYAEKYVAPYVYASTPQDRQLQIFSQFLLSGSTTEPISIEFENFEGKRLKHKISREPWIMEEEMLNGKPFEFRLLANNIGYLKINNFVASENIRNNFDSIYEKILLTDGLIIDVRENVGGATDISLYILKHFTNKTFKTGKWRSPKNIAAHRSWGSKTEWFESDEYEVLPFDNKVIYTKPMVLLADESTFSCAEDFCIGFLTINRGKMIGAKTAGSSGNPIIFKLPGDGIALVCSKQDFFPDGREYVGFGITPDIEIKPTIKEIIQNRDTVLEIAVKEILK